ncbi:uncharacterized protein ACOB8E_007999 isoform 3-T5 [Sarcophilus harrisii]
MENVLLVLLTSFNSGINSESCNEMDSERKCRVYTAVCLLPAQLQKYSAQQLYCLLWAGSKILNYLFLIRVLLGCSGLGHWDYSP